MFTRNENLSEPPASIRKANLCLTARQCGMVGTAKTETTLQPVNLAKVENKLFVLSREVGGSVYDFDFDLHFACEHPHRIENGLRLINSPAEHALTSEIEHWYPLIRELTPRTQVFEVLPAPEEIEAHFDWPIFLKGSRQTSRHDPDLSIITSRSHYERVAQSYHRDPSARK